MSEITRRRFWRFHLSTAVALMLVAGGLIGANLADRMPRPATYDLSGQVDLDEVKRWLALIGVEHQYGWPSIANEIYHPLNVSGGSGSYVDLPLLGSRWNRAALVIDSLTAIGMLLAVGIVSEWFIRRNEAAHA